VCYSNKVCGPPLPNGSTCEDDTVCQSGRCGTDATNKTVCIAAISGAADGQPCSADADCQSKYCKGVCLAVVKPAPTQSRATLDLRLGLGIGLVFGIFLLIMVLVCVCHRRQKKQNGMAA